MPDKKTKITLTIAMRGVFILLFLLNIINWVNYVYSVMHTAHINFFSGKTIMMAVMVLYVLLTFLISVIILINNALLKEYFHLANCVLVVLIFVFLVFKLKIYYLCACAALALVHCILFCQSIIRAGKTKTKEPAKWGRADCLAAGAGLNITTISS